VKTSEFQPLQAPCRGNPPLLHASQKAVTINSSDICYGILADMIDSRQNPTTPPSPARKIAYTCGTFTLVASLVLSLAAIAAAVLILMGILP
jgi:hypothetical protein